MLFLVMLSIEPRRRRKEERRRNKRRKRRRMEGEGRGEE